MIAEKLEWRIYKPREKIITNGEEAYEMFIVYQGEVGVYVDNECSKCVAVLNENKIFGESALDKNMKRSATVIAHTSVKVLALHKVYYWNILSVTYMFIFILYSF